MGYEVAVVGGGIVGLAVARAVTKALPSVDLCVVEKEPDVGLHQTGHNSGVLHTGLYYKPGSLKAKLCVEGHRQMTEFCAEAGVPLKRRGKLVIASSPDEVARLNELHRRGRANGLRGLRLLGADELTEIEPHATGVAALHVPDASVVDFVAAATRLADSLDGDVLTGEPVVGIDVGREVELHRPGSTVRARFMINCAGLHSDRVARMAGAEPSVQIVPFRGEYYLLAQRSAALVASLIYPVPDPAFPFLGVHFTRRVDDSVEVGPNAVLALGREHYRGTRPNVPDLTETLRFAGFRRLAQRYWRTGSAEVWRSRSRRRYAASAQTLVPDVLSDDLRRGGAGVRAQAVRPSGELVDDFVIAESPSCIHVLNAPSPAATASLAIGEHIADLVKRRLSA